MQYSLWEIQNNHPTTITAIINGKNATPLIPENMQKVLEDIYSLITKQINTQITDTTIWHTSDIASWLKLSEGSVRRSVLVQPSFPKPINLGEQNANAARRWFAKDIINWVKYNQSNIPQGRKSRGRPRSLKI